MEEKEKKKSNKTLIIILIIVAFLLVAILGVILLNPFSKTCKVTFDPNGGTMNVTEVTVDKGRPVTEPEESPVKEGYVFKSWQLDGVDYVFALPVKKNIKLVANYIERIEVLDAQFNQQSYTIIEGETIPINYTIFPSDGTDEVVITAEDTLVCNVKLEDDIVTITGIMSGKTKLILKVNDIERIATVEVLPNADSVSLDKTLVEVSVGEEVQLVATVFPENAADKTLLWKIENEEIATVDQEGKVKGIKKGSTRLTVTTTNGKSVSCDVKVEEYEIESITFEKGKIDLEKGKTVTLNPIIKPDKVLDKTVTYQSANPSIATVDANGKVTAVAAGTTTVAAIGKNGMSGSVTINVIVYPTSVYFDPTVYYVEVGGTVQAQLRFEPSDCTEKDVTFTLNSSLASVDADGLITGREFEVSSATLKVTTSNGKMATAQVYVKGGKINSNGPDKTCLYWGGSMTDNFINVGGATYVYRKTNTTQVSQESLEAGVYTIEFSTDNVNFSTSNTYVRQGEGPGNLTKIWLKSNPTEARRLYYRLATPRDENGKKYYSTSYSFTIEPKFDHNSMNIVPANGVSCNYTSGDATYSFSSSTDSGNITINFLTPVKAVASNSNISNINNQTNSAGLITSTTCTVTAYNHGGGHTAGASMRVTTDGGQVLNITFNP